MRRIKIFVGATLLLLSFIGLTASSKDHPSAADASEASISSLTNKKAVVDPAVKRHYQLRQQELRRAVQAYFENAIASGDIVGAGLSIVKGDSIVISDGFGKRSIQTKAQVDGETVFRLGSLSKGFAGVLTAGLKHEGKLDFQDKVIDYLPEFRLGDRDNTKKIKLAHILSHTSGTPYHSFTNLVEAGLPMKNIAGRFNEVTPISEPGAMYSYQNAMFALSGEVVRKVTGNDIGTALEQRFFKPLGMRTACTDYKTLIQEENIAKPHVKSRKRWRSKKLTDHYDNAIAAGGINASALDMAKWMRFLLGHNPEIMKKSVLAEAFNPFIEISSGRKYYYRWPGHITSYYGFGWRIHTFEGVNAGEEKTIWHHGGSVNNFRNEIAVYPEADLGICVLLNSNSKLAKTVIPDLYQIVTDIYEKTAQNSHQTVAQSH